MVQDIEDILVYIDDTIEQDVEQLSENGADRMFHHLSIVFATLYHLLSYCKTAAEAEEMASVCLDYALAHEVSVSPRVTHLQFELHVLSSIFDSQASKARGQLQVDVRMVTITAAWTGLGVIPS